MLSRIALAPMHAWAHIYSISDYTQVNRRKPFGTWSNLNRFVHGATDIMKEKCRWLFLSQLLASEQIQGENGCSAMPLLIETALLCLAHVCSSADSSLQADQTHETVL